MGALTLLSFVPAFALAWHTGGELPNLIEFARLWSAIGEYVRADLGEYAFLYVFAGLWLGAASHTIADIAGSFVKTGRVSEFL